MTTRMQAAQARLEEVLNSPPTGRSRHAQTVDLARRHALQARADDLIVKQVAATDVEADPSGQFVAMVSDYKPDRDGDRFLPGAWTTAIARIRQAGRPLPLLFGHDTHNAGSVIGPVQPDDIWADAKGLWIRGWLDVGDSLGQRLHRMVQRGVLSLSVGFSVARKQRGTDGINELVEVGELYEVSATPVPANPRAVTTSSKATDRIPTRSELLERETALGLEGALARLEHGRRVIAPSLAELHAREDALRSDGVIAAVERMRYRRAPALDIAVARMREQTREQIRRILGDDTPRKSRDPLRARAGRPCGRCARGRPDRVSQEFELERALSHDRRASGQGRWTGSSRRLETAGCLGGRGPRAPGETGVALEMAELWLR
jgi:HK97 family phage prohead protease